MWLPNQFGNTPSDLVVMRWEPEVNMGEGAVFIALPTSAVEKLL
jgi:hypothetical protein